MSTGHVPLPRALVQGGTCTTKLRLKPTSHALKFCSLNTLKDVKTSAFGDKEEFRLSVFWRHLACLAGNSVVAQISESAVSPTSQSARHPLQQEHPSAFNARQVWKPAIRQ